jgi:hypothetical protein
MTGRGIKCFELHLISNKTQATNRCQCQLKSMPMPIFLRCVFLAFLYRKVSHQQHEKSINQCLLMQGNETVKKKRNLCIKREKCKNCKKSKVKSQTRVHCPSVSTRFDSIRHPWHSNHFPNHLQMLTSDIGAKLRRLFFFNSVPEK